MKVGILKKQYGKLTPFIIRYAETLAANNLGYIFLDINSPDFWKTISTLDFFIYQWGHNDFDRQVALTILPVIEKEYGVKCFPNLSTCWHYDDKVAEYYMLRAHGLPITKSWIFWDRRAAIEWAQSAEYPVVFKLKSGASSNGVILLEKPRTAIRLINKMFRNGILPGEIPLKSSTKWKDFNIFRFIRHKGGNALRRLRHEDAESCWVPNKNYVLFQKFLPNNAFDTRVTIIGNHAYAFRRFNRKNDFRSSGSGLLDHDPTKIDFNHLKKAFQISQKMNFQSMAYDFLYNENGESEFLEISYTYLDSGPQKCPGYWDSNLIWHEGHFWPQTIILQDLLKVNNLIQP
jgi:glutathione synthase/RimK-type ligase-like ATP-grasp enzyme